MNDCIIVTGATKGIGLAIAKGFAKENNNLVITYKSDISKEEQEKIIKEFSEYNIEVLLKQVDVKDYQACEELVNEVYEKFDSVKVLVNNAGITKDNLTIKMSESDFKDVIDTNLVGTFNMSKLIGKKMFKQKEGNIINVASVIGVMGNLGQSNYAASKAGVIGFTKSLAKEMALRNVRVNCVAPGFIETRMTSVLDEKVSEKIMENIPLKRYGQPEDVADAVLFLASPRASYITGQVINICGGLLM